MKNCNSREQFEKAKESFSKVGTAAQKTAVEIGKLLREGGKATAYALDGVDKWIGSKIQTKNVLFSRMKDHLLKLALAGGLLFNVAPKASDQIPNNLQKSEPESHLVQGVDVSHFNNFELEQLVAENHEFRNDGDTLTRPKEFIILRASQGAGKHQNGPKKGKNLNDVKFSEYLSQLQSYNQHCDQKEKLAFATYHLYVPGHGVEEQVNNYWKMLSTELGETEAKKQTPILDIEMNDINRVSDKKALFNDLLKRCTLAEEKFGKKPLIYTSHSAIRDYFRHDKRFAGFQFWSASYGKNNLTSEIVQQQGGTSVLSENDIAIHQFTEQGEVAGLGNAKGKTDINVMSRDDYEKHFSA